ncbi:MAG TPA: SUMF1/EgtB/PvdO family nonheme iron enzyme [Verrucomicrobiota bacterium]|nr:SUMF1/EgtB/PvdO family nonheme iron enzyme [Verrucomicrobiota bacterium]HNU49792.1 SUMF1/EgtB/PvdO family nonheme iron enzyme [Verrucomicrobiota bacterium]
MKQPTPHPLTRRQFLQRATTAGIACGVPVLSTLSALASDGSPSAFDHEIIPAPEDPAEWGRWRQRLDAWRRQRRSALGYDDTLYARPDFAWARGCFSCCFLMLCDERFWNRRSGRWTVAEFLSASRRDFGGFDAVVLWHAYPRIGADDRNQFDFYRHMPGGLPGLRNVVRELHQAGVRAFLDYNPWDRGTRPEPKSDLDTLCDLVRDLDADGIFLDTLKEGAAVFRSKLDAVRPGVVLESEIALPLERVHDHHLSWAQWFHDSRTPGVLRNKWFEPRHLQHQIRRWDMDHSGEIQTAWMNGSGMMVWENVFGSWVGWSPRDRSLLRAILPLQRRFCAIFTGGEWTPLVPTLVPDVFASRWERDGVALWTLVNRSHHPFAQPLLEIALDPGEAAWDLVAGRRLIRSSPSGRGQATPRPVALSPGIAARGVGCLLRAAPARLGPDFSAFLRRQRRLAAVADWATTAPEPVAQPQPPRSALRRAMVPPDMAEIPAATVELTTQLRARECGYYTSVLPADPRMAPAYEFRLVSFTRQVTLDRYALDLTPVTNAQFADFLRATSYQPRHPERFLAHWPDWRRLRMPDAQEQHPVVCVDLEDARAYARWRHKRLPSEEEWQYAAQGPAAWPYPWGHTMEPARCNGGETGGTTPVTQFPRGRASCGCWDLCGNVWEWTESERSDGRTRFCLLKGGSFYTAKGSGWYFDGGPRPNAYSAKFLLMWPGLDRCATIGFRCALDLS